jgi:SNF2 family DNA or RNA helicase
LIQEGKSKDVWITSYDLLKRDYEQYQECYFDIHVIDEAQYIKNASTQAAKAVKSISSNTRIALTGTPIENRLSELWSIFDFLMPGLLFSYKHFKEEIETAIVNGTNKDGQPDTKASIRLKNMVRPFILRRLKEDVLKDLPKKMEHVVYAKMEGEQQKLYDARVQMLKQSLENQTDEQFKNNKIQILSELTRLRQICCDPLLCYEDYKGASAKLSLCMEMIADAVESGHKMLIFSQFTTMLDRIGKELEKEKISYYKLTGATKKEQRIEMANDFNENEVPVFLISLRAGGTGLNLVGADMVIHFDPWWNLAAQNQATDRAHRIGQKRAVTVFKMIAAQSIEEKILALQEKKKDLADQIISDEGMSEGRFTREDLLEIL